MHTHLPSLAWLLAALLTVGLGALPQVAHAQVVTAWTSSEQPWTAAHHESMPLSDGGVLMVHQLDTGGFMIERRGPDLQVMWTDKPTLPALPELGYEPRWFALFQGDMLFSLKPEQVLNRRGSWRMVQAGDELRVVFSTATSVVALRYQVDTGEKQRQVLLSDLPEQSYKVLLLADEHLAVATASAGSERRQVYLFDDTLSSAQELVYDRGSRDRRLTLDHAGNLLRLTAPSEQQLAVVRTDAVSGETRTTPIDTFGYEIAWSRLVVGQDDTAWVLALAPGSWQRASLLLTARVNTASGAVLSEAPFEVRDLMPRGGSRDLSTFVPRGAEVLEDGSVLLHGQHVQSDIDMEYYSARDPITGLYDRRSGSSKMVFNYGDVLAMRFTAEGEHAWSSAIPVRLRAEAESEGAIYMLTEQGGYTSRVHEGLLRVQYLRHERNNPFSDEGGRRAVLQDIKLDSGDIFPATSLTPLATDEALVRALSQPSADGSFWVTTRLQPHVLTGQRLLLSRVELDAPPPVPTLVDQQLFGEARSEQYKTGYLVGHRSAGTQVDLRGLAWGGGLGAGGAAAVAGGALLFTGMTPPGCALASAVGCLGCLGGMGAARFTLGAPNELPFSDPDPNFQAGYSAGYRAAQRRQQLRWAAVGGAAVVATGLLVGGSGVVDFSSLGGQ